MNYLPLAVAIAFSVFWYRGAHAENISPLIWVGPSLAISVVIAIGLGGGWIAVAMGQVAMFFAITVYRVLSEKEPS